MLFVVLFGITYPWFYLWFYFSTAEEYLLSAGNRMSRKQLRNCLRNTKLLYEEFWVSQTRSSARHFVLGRVFEHSTGTKSLFHTVVWKRAIGTGILDLSDVYIA